MRFQRTAALVTVALGVHWFGPLVALGALLLLVLPRVGPRLRAWLRPTWRIAGAWALAVVLVAGVVVVVPEGWLPVPSGPGALAVPGYVGRPAPPQPLDVEAPGHPGLAAGGAVHGDAGRSGTTAWAGPLGESPVVDSAWYGLEGCGALVRDSAGRLVAVCRTTDGPLLRVIDPESMRPVATKPLPDRDDLRAWTDACFAPEPYVDPRGRVVLATSDRRVLAVSTADADGEPDLTTEAAHDLSALVPADDCVVALAPARADGWTWFATRDGRVGTIGPGAASAAGRVVELGEQALPGIAVDRYAAYVATTGGVHRIRLAAGGRPRLDWRAAYEGEGSTPPTLLPDGAGLVATAQGMGTRLEVTFHSARSGAELCRATVFGEGAATRGSLVSVGGGVVVTNQQGYAGPWRLLFGRGTAGGVARVDADAVGEGDCRVVWSSPEVVPSVTPVLSRSTGLLYAWAKRPSRLGVDGWYLTALDSRTGRRRWAVRAGLGVLFDGHRSTLALGPDGGAWAGTVGGLVRVRDRE